MPEWKTYPFRKKTITLSIIAIAISIIAIGVSLYGVDHAFQLQEPYMVRRDPTLNHIWIDSDTSFFKTDLEKLGNDMEDIQICFYNEGRAPTGTINARWESSILVSSGIYIANIPGGQAKCDSINVHGRYPLCEHGEEGALRTDCNLETVPNETQVSLYVDCNYCLEGPFYKNFTFCFHEEGIPPDFVCE